MSQYTNLVNYLLGLIGVLEIDRASPLYQDTIAVCDYLQSSKYRIAVFAPFNHGKSTLLNALLGSKTLPIDLIPSTGAAFCINYGEQLQTVITLKNGDRIQQDGTKILKEYAILDEERRMKDEVKEVEVSCDLPWLKTGIEFLDLPGTNDREAQNDLIKHKLLSADLVVHVLDARKLMTLEEKEHLEKWLQNRGITTVIFVVNFLNLLTPEERQQVRQRIYFIAESFRSSLPAGISNIYCVDALPALRARIKGNISDAKTAGIVDFESALAKIIAGDRQPNLKLQRGVKIAEDLLQQAKAKQAKIELELANQQAKLNQQIEVKQKAEKLIQPGFNRSISDFMAWLYLPQLLSEHLPSLAIALQEGRFDDWLESQFKPEVLERQQAINKWVHQGCDFFQYECPQLLAIQFTDLPEIIIPKSAIDQEAGDRQTYKSYIPQELNFLLQKKAGAVVLGRANYLINQLANSKSSQQTTNHNSAEKISSQVYIDAAETYLQKFSDRAIKLLDTYEPIGRKYTTFIPKNTTQKNSSPDPQLELLTNFIYNVQSEISLLTDTA
ncbi:MAG: dynamin family protein [Cyanobacteria bacterium P01_G01_bin.19]